MDRNRIRCCSRVSFFSVFFFFFFCVARPSDTRKAFPLECLDVWLSPAGPSGGTDEELIIYQSASNSLASGLRLSTGRILDLSVQSPERWPENQLAISTQIYQRQKNRKKKQLTKKNGINCCNVPFLTTNRCRKH